MTLSKIVISQINHTQRSLHGHFTHHCAIVIIKSYFRADIMKSLSALMDPDVMG